MKTGLVFLFFLFLMLPARAQQNYPFEKGFEKLKAFDPDDAWQSKFLFDYDVHFYGLDLSVFPDTTFLRGHVTVGATTLVDNLDTFAIELIPQMVVDSAFFDSVQLASPERDADNLLFSIPTIRKKGTSFSVKIYYHGTSPTGGFFAGVSTAYNKTWKKQVAWTLSEPFAAKTWFPVKQDLKDKADSAWIFLTVDSGYMAGSEGLLTRIADLGNGKKRYEWKTRYPIDYYLLSFAVSDYRDFSFYAHPGPAPDDSLLVQNYIYNSDAYLQENRKAIERTGRFIELYAKLFGPYPFGREKYGHCLTELHGGMEHQTMTTLGGFGFDLVAHELGHMWFGDNVTCADWSDIWVNEGFATYADYLANEYINGDSIARIFMKHAQDYAMSQPGGSIYIPPDQIYPGNEWRIFNGRLSYDKGAAIIHMLRHEIGDDTVFYRVLKTYQKNYAGGTATGADFKSTVNAVTGKDFTRFFDQWYYGEGYPVFYIQWYRKADTVFLFSTETTSTQNPAFFKMLQDYQFVFSDGSDTVVRLWQTSNTEQYKVVFPHSGKEIKALHVDPFHWNLQKVYTTDYVGIRESENPVSFTLGPVPATRFLWMQLLHPSRQPVRVEIMDIQGRKVLTTSFSGTRLRLDVSGLKHGLYVVRASVNGHGFIRKFIR